MTKDDLLEGNKELIDRAAELLAPAAVRALGRNPAGGESAAWDS
ncbi:MAG TPA: hypothetical protein VLU25_20945 [Acidobacteriota bacterium]|nr:hypothetical protein [Acidobacteriota bacterium]